MRHADLLLGLGGSFLTNIFDQFRLGNDEQPARRLMVLLVVAIPPFVLAYSGMVSFVNALYFAGVFSGVILSIMPILMLKGARQRGDLTPRLDLSGLDDPSAYPMLHCVVVSLQRRLRDSVRGRLPARWLVIRACFAPRPVHAGAVFLFVTYLLHSPQFSRFKFLRMTVCLA